ncbi:MAG TPA: hypothetical protein VI277_03640 [Candidatus Limnocylindria bacterium]
MIETFYLVLFLLFFAVLAAAYFYLQRAKARDAKTEATAEASAAPASTAAAAAAPVDSAPAPSADDGTDSPTT